MKKAFAITALMILLICLLCACAEKRTEATLDTMAGSYIMVDAAGEGSKELLKIKDGIRLEVRDDNTATLSLMTDVHELYFDEKSKICTSTDEQEVPYTFDGKQIVMDTVPFRMVFERI